MTDLAVIACHFNPCGYTAPRVNLFRFVRHIQRDGLPLFGVEAYWKGQDPVTSGLPGWTQILVAESGKVFQKEALLNAAARLVPAQYTKLVAVDADLTFADPGWAAAASKALDTHVVIQPFATAVFEAEDGREERRVPASAAVVSADPKAGHPGFAVGAVREFWDVHGGFYAYSPIGAGDVLSMAAFKGATVSDNHAGSMGGTWEARLNFQAWQEGVSFWTEGRIGHIPGELWHSYHGSLADRSYVSRNQCIAGLNPSEHLEIMPEGWLSWSRNAPAEMMAAVARYFSNRKEDG